MIKRKRSDDEDLELKSSTAYSSDSLPKPPKFSKLEQKSDLTAPNSTPPTSVTPSYTEQRVIMNPPVQSGQSASGATQGPTSTMEETRQKYIQIQQSLKNEIQQFGQNHPRGIAAMKKLEQFNQHMAHLRSQQQSQRQAAAAANAANQQTQIQMQAAAQARPAVTAVGPNTTARPPPAATTTTQPATANPPAGTAPASQPMKLLVPGHIDADNADNWRREAESRLRTAYASMVQFRNQMQAIQTSMNNAEKSLSAEEMLEKRTQLETIQKQNKKCEDFINAFRLQQTTLAANIRNAASNNTASTEQVIPSGPTSETVVESSNSNVPNAAPVVPGSATVSKASLSKAPIMQRTPSNFSPVGNVLATAVTPNSGNTTSAQPGSQKSPTSATPLRNQTSVTAFPSSVSTTSQQSPTQVPNRIVSTSAGMVASHSGGSSQALTQPPVPESPAKAASGPSAATVGQREGASSHRLPIPKTLTMPAPTAVVVPPSRPTLPGGTHVPSGSQVVGGPAIAKAPQFELDEASGGLLSKRKLQELVRQIDPEESLDPEVEESILELTDDFVDTLLTYACRMAKHRGSDALDIRDVQMILERNWNIRIPGYSMDDIRTVRKFNPTASYLQKLQALQAGKALNQSEMSSKDS